MARGGAVRLGVWDIATAYDHRLERISRAIFSVAAASMGAKTARAPGVDKIHPGGLQSGCEHQKATGNACVAPVVLDVLLGLLVRSNLFFR